MAEDNEVLDLPFNLTDDSFGIQEVENFADTLFSKTDAKDLVTLEEAKKKEEAEKVLALKAAEKKNLSADDLLEKEENLEPEDDPEPEDKNEGQFESISKGLVRLGVFSEEGELPKTADEFAERFQHEKQKGASDWINNFLSSEHGEEGIDLFRAIFVDKIDPREYFSVHNEILNLQELDITNDINQKKVFREFYKDLGWDEIKIEAKLQKSIDYGDLESDSKEYYDALLNKKEASKQQLEDTKRLQIENRSREEATYKDSIVKVLEEKLKIKDFNGIPINSDKVKKVIEFLTVKKYQTPDKQQLTEYDKYMLESRKPENISNRILTALLAIENFNFDSIKKRAVTKETDEVFSELKTKTKVSAQKSKKDDWFSNSL